MKTNIEKIVEELISDVGLRLEYCRIQNGRPSCKNCGLSPNDLKKLKQLTKALTQVKDRREQELYIIAEACNAKGWDFDRYLRTWAVKMSNELSNSLSNNKKDT